jgi:hypothetical protein
VFLRPLRGVLMRRGGLLQLRFAAARGWLI